METVLSASEPQSSKHQVQTQAKGQVRTGPRASPQSPAPLPSEAASPKQPRSRHDVLPLPRDTVSLTAGLGPPAWNK